MLPLQAIAALAFAAGVVAHGYVRDYTFDGVKYVSYLPYSEPDFTQKPVGIGE